MGSRFATPFDGLLGVAVPQSTQLTKGRRVIPGWLVACRAEAMHTRALATRLDRSAAEPQAAAHPAARAPQAKTADKPASFPDPVALTREIKATEARCWAEIAAKVGRQPTRRNGRARPATPSTNG